MLHYFLTSTTINKLAIYFIYVGHFFYNFIFSLNSSDSEYTGGEDSGELREGGRRRSKVNRKYFS